MSEDYAGRQVVGMDLHRRRSVLVRMTEDGRKLGTARITNSPAALRAEIARAGENPRVVLEATYGWYWAADTLEAAGAEVHLAHPLGVKAYGYQRVKTDARDAANHVDEVDVQPINLGQELGEAIEPGLQPPPVVAALPVAGQRSGILYTNPLRPSIRAGSRPRWAAQQQPTTWSRGYRTQAWLAVSHDPATTVSGGYWYHRQRQAPAPQARDPAFEDQLMDQLATLTDIALF
jgi:hypothetical protein